MNSGENFLKALRLCVIHLSVWKYLWSDLWFWLCHKSWIAFLQASYGDLCPFSVALLLSVARIQRYEEQVGHNSYCPHLILFDLSCLLTFSLLSLVWVGVWPFEGGNHQELQGWAAAAGVKVPAGPPAWALQCGSDDSGHSQEQVRASKQLNL